MTVGDDGTTYEWEEAVGGSRQTQPCQTTVDGNAVRTCLSGGGFWTPVDVTDCISCELTCTITLYMCDDVIHAFS